MQLLLKLFTLFGVLIFYSQCDTSEETTISVATLLEAPYTMFRELSENMTLTGNERFEGYIIDLLKLIAKRTDFKFDVHILEDGRYGALLDGEWNGLIGEVISGRAKIGAAPITITSYRENAVDFTMPFMNLGITILYKRASDGKVLPFTNVEELAESKTTTFGCVRGGSTCQFFALSDNPTYKRIFERMASTEGSFVYTVSEGIERAKTEDYAFFMESSSLEYVVQRECDLQQVGGHLNSKSFGLVVQKGSPMRSKLSEVILELQETGELMELKEKWWRKKDGEKCSN